MQFICQNKKTSLVSAVSFVSLLVLSDCLSASLFCVSLWPFSLTSNLSSVFLSQSPCAFVAVKFPICSVPKLSVPLVFGINMNEPHVSPLGFTALSGDKKHLFVFFLQFSLPVHTYKQLPFTCICSTVKSSFLLLTQVSCHSLLP